MKSKSPSPFLPSAQVVHRCLLLLITAVVMGGLASCNTTRGFGRDVKKVGNKIENAAN